MAIEKNAFKTINIINESKDDMNNLETDLFNPYIPYEIVSSKTGVMHGVNFQENVPTKVTGWLAKKIVKDSLGFVKFFDREAIKEEIRQEEIKKAEKEAIKAELKAELGLDKEVKKETPIAKPKSSSKKK